MLVLSRKCGERVVFPDQNIVVTLLEIHGGQVRLGIEAPQNVSIYRQEIWERIQNLTEPVSAAVGDS